MKRTKNLIFLVVFLMISTMVVNAQTSLFQFGGENAKPATNGKREITPLKYGVFNTDITAVKTFLWTLPSEKSLNANRSNAPIMQIPMPDGSSARFKVWESNVMESGLAAKFSEMRQFLGQGVDDPYATIRFDYNPYTGFHAQILSPVTGRIFIDPYANGDKNIYISYFARDIVNRQSFTCEVEDVDYPSGVGNRTAAACQGTTLRTYRLALACTGEYAIAVNGPTPTVPGVAAAMLTAVNRVTGVYENEVSVRLQLVSNNNLLIYLDPNTDPYTNNNGGTMLGQNQTTCDAVIGSANYDIGHVFSTGGGGVAGLGVICSNGSKARGVTGLPNPVGDDFYIDYVAHEMGHQFGGNHTFNSTTSNCGGGNRNGSTAYEVGSGTTIQGYAGICGADNIQPHSDPYFHGISFDEISNRITSTSCAATSSTGNTLPVIDALLNSGLTIPISTPFTLSGTASDANGDPLTYSWEQWDLGPGGAWNSGATGGVNNTLPLFKSRVPKTNGNRTFPDMAVILAGYPANPAATMGGLKGETLSPVARTMNFRLTVRDNRAGGGGTVSSGGGGCQNSTPFVVNVAGTTPFSVTSPNGSESYPGGSTQTITWNNANTNAAPFNVANVKITLSTDGGLTYPTVITNSTPNDGTEALTIPAVPATTTARIKIEAVGNIFFDISDNNFSITIPVNGYSFGSPSAGTATCPAAGPINATLPVNFLGSYTGPVTFSYLSGAPGGTTVTVSPSTLSANGSLTVSLNSAGALAPGTYNVVVQGVGPAPGGTQNATVSFTINPGSGPSVSSQPSNVIVCAGGNATYSVTATGVTNYQWQVSTTGCGGTFTNISGANAASYTASSVTAAMNGYAYRCVLTGQCGVTTTNCATLTVNTAPAITAQPTDMAVCSGSAASFSVTATGTGIGYQWQLSTDGGATWNNISGAASATYTLASTVIGQNGNKFRCVVTGTCTPAATSNVATLTVNSSVTVTSNPASQTICEGTGTSFSAAASGTGLIYQWQVSTDGGVTWNNVANGANYSGASTLTLTLINTPPTFNQNRYRCFISSPPCTPGITSSALLTVNSFPVITAQPVSQTFCEGSNVTISVSATTSVGALSYQWQASTNNGASWFNLVLPGSTVTPTNTNTLSQTAVSATQNGYLYRCAVTAGCGTTNSSSAKFTVNTYPAITLNGLPKAVCLSDGSQTLSASYPGGTWAGTGVSGSGLFTPTAAGVGEATISYTASNAGCSKTVSSKILVDECSVRHRKLNEKNAVLIMPNPNQGRFKLKMNTDLYTKLSVKVFDAAGKLYRAFEFDGLGYGSVIPMDLTALSQGTYFLYMYNSENGFISRGDGILMYH